MIDYKVVMNHWGRYMNFGVATLQFNSIIFRVVVGFLVGAPLEAIAISSSIEYWLNLILEVPTGYLADKYGRVPMALLGHVFVILGILCCYIAIIPGIEIQTSYNLFILSGIFIGFFKPLISGSVDAFYQTALENSSDSDGKKSGVLKNSFMLSRQSGRKIGMIFIIAAFTLIYLLSLYDLARHVYLAGIGLWIMTFSLLYSDYRKLGDKSSVEIKSLSVLKQFIGNTTIWRSIFYSISYGLTSGIVLGFYLVSLGRGIQGQEKWLAMISFMIFSQGVVWLFASSFLDKVKSFFKLKFEHAELGFGLFLYFIQIICSVLFFLFWDEKNIIVIIGFTAIFGLVVRLAIFGFQGISKNLLVSQIPKENYSMSLSLLSMPIYAVTGVYSMYLWFFKEGAPSLSELFSTLIILNVTLFIIASILYFASSKDSREAF